MHAVPHAVCRSSGDRPETGLSGEVSADERDAWRRDPRIQGNTDPVGQFKGEGASWQLAAWKNCAYFDQRNPAMAPLLVNPGSVAVDVTDPTNPTGNAAMHRQDIATDRSVGIAEGQPRAPTARRRSASPQRIGGQSRRRILRLATFRPTV